MDSMVKYNGSKLRAIPAVHYRAVFAREANYICSQKATRPDAIAVELGPHMVAEILKWMNESDNGPFHEPMLPCMLGILAKNRLIHPEYYDSAIFLQEYFKKPLHQISHKLLRDMLHYSDQFLVGLSSTDSIIEAIRCGFELGLPVYGVDLDEFAPAGNKQLLIEDPTNPTFDLSGYVSKNEKRATQIRDPYVDGRREQVMAARLKTILTKHKDVLFTGGIAHWGMIKNLLVSSEIRPADFLIPEHKPDFKRVIVHPRLALMFMDAYPILTTRYEENRSNPFFNGSKAMLLPDMEDIMREVLQKTYVQYYNECESGNACHIQNKERQKIPDFERLLETVRMVHQKNVNSFSNLLKVAGSMMSQDFVRILSSQMMEIGRSWASPSQFPDLPLISNIQADLSDQISQMPEDLFQLTENQRNDQEQLPTLKKKSAPFSLKFQQGNRFAKNVLRLWHWIDEPKEPSGRFSWNTWVWPPCEALLFGTAYEAAKIAASESNDPEPAVFEGSLYNGVDVKASVRSIIRGERKIYIRKPSSAKRAFSPDGKKPEPTVFIFEESIGSPFTWSLLIGGSSLGFHIKDKARYEEVVRKSGSYFISSISALYDVETPQHLKQHVDNISMLRGITAFGSPCINAYQGAQWVEDNDYQCCPVLPYTGFNLLIDNYKQKHQMDIPVNDWQSALILFAIPYAKERVVVIAPEKFRIPNPISIEAKRRRIDFSVLPLSYFPAARIDEMRQRVMVNALDPNGCEYSAQTEAALGQRSDKYRELLPVYMQQQLIITP